MMSTPTCETCRFWGTDFDDDKNVCHRFPPFIPGPNGGTTKFPFTRDNWWCGEHQPKQKEDRGNDKS